MKFYLITITILIPFLSYSQIEKIDTVADTLQVNNKTSTKSTVKYWMDSTKTSIIQQQEVVKSQQTIEDGQIFKIEKDKNGIITKYKR